MREATGGVTPCAEAGRRTVEEWQMEEVLEEEEMGRGELEEKDSEGETDGAAEPAEVVGVAVVVGCPPPQQEEVREQREEEEEEVMGRRRWEEREKEMEERVVQEQEEAQMKNLEKGKMNNKYSRGLMWVQTHNQQRP